MILSQVMTISNFVNQNYFWKLLFSLNCHNLAQNHANFARWGCFGNLRTSSWWWAQRFSKLMHLKLSNSRKTESLILNRAKCIWDVLTAIAVVYCSSGLKLTSIRDRDWWAAMRNINTGLLSSASAAGGWAAVISIARPPDTEHQSWLGLWWCAH